MFVDTQSAHPWTRRASGGVRHSEQMRSSPNASRASTLKIIDDEIRVDWPPLTLELAWMNAHHHHFAAVLPAP